MYSVLLSPRTSIFVIMQPVGLTAPPYGRNVILVRGVCVRDCIMAHVCVWCAALCLSVCLSVWRQMHGIDKWKVWIWQLIEIEQSAGQNVSLMYLNSAVPGDGFDLGRNMQYCVEYCCALRLPAELNENLSSGNRVVPCGQTDRRTDRQTDRQKWRS